MHMAGYKARVDVMRELLTHKADINAVNDKGETPLYVCIKQEGDWPLKNKNSWP